MAELVDAADSKSAVLTDMSVRVRPPAPLSHSLQQALLDNAKFARPVEGLHQIIDGLLLRKGRGECSETQGAWTVAQCVVRIGMGFKE